MSGESDVQLNRQIYLPPEMLTANEANEKARPSESPQSREERVVRMMESIRTVGQKYPVLVVEIEPAEPDASFTYEYIDGGCRVDAMLRMNLDVVDGPTRPTPVWCSIVPGDSDLFRTAITANLHRTQNSVLEMGMICREARERNGWKGRGASAKVAEYLGVSPSRVSEYEKILRGATPDIKARIESGEIQSVDAVLRLMRIDDPEVREQVAERASEIAQEEQTRAGTASEDLPDFVEPKLGDVTFDPEEDFYPPRPDGADDTPESGKKVKKSKSEARCAEDRGHSNYAAAHTAEEKQWMKEQRELHKKRVAAEKAEKAEKAKTKAKHIDAAAREREAPAGPRTRKQITDFFTERTGPAYAAKVTAFCGYFIDTWCAGAGSDRKAGELFDTMVGLKSPGAAKPPKPPKPPKPVKAVKVAKSAKLVLPWRFKAKGKPAKKGAKTK